MATTTPMPGPIDDVIQAYARLLIREEDPFAGLFTVAEMQLLDSVQLRLTNEGVDVTALARELEANDFRTPLRFLDDPDAAD